MKQKLIFTTLLLFTGFLSWAQEISSDYKIFSKEKKSEIPFSEFINELKVHQVIFWGEEHNDSIGHLLEFKTLNALYNNNSKNLKLSMEMFDRDCQPVMDEYLNGLIKEKHFNKDARIWSNYLDYKSMIEFCKLNNVPIICANAPTRYTNMAGRLGQATLKKISPTAKKFIAPLPYDTANGLYLEKIYVASGHAVPSSSSSTKITNPQMQFSSFNMNQGQSLWDATMAFSIYENLKKNKSAQIFQINGRFHSDQGLGIMTHLRNRSSKVDMVNISCVQNKEINNLNWDSIENQNGDFIIVTKSNKVE